MNVTVLIGAPGCGKGTRIQQCVDKKGYIKIGTGDLLRKSGYDVSSGKLIEDKTVIELLNKELENYKYDNSKIILDGFPRNISQAKMLIQAVDINKVIYLTISEEESLKRATDRLICSNHECQATYTKSEFKRPKNMGICDICGSKLIIREDDKPETVKKRLKLFSEETKPVIDFFESKDIQIVTIDAMLPPEEILKFV